MKLTVAEIELLQGDLPGCELYFQLVVVVLVAHRGLHFFLLLFAKPHTQCQVNWQTMAGVG